MIMEFCENPEGHHSAVSQKYTNHKYGRVSIYVRDAIDRGFALPSSERPVYHQIQPQKRHLKVFISDTAEQNYKGISQAQSLNISIPSQTGYEAVVLSLQLNQGLNALMNRTLYLGILVVVCLIL